MKNKFDLNKIKLAKSRDLVEVKCDECNKSFKKSKNEILMRLNGKDEYKRGWFCSKKCCQKNKENKVNLFCSNCNKNFKKLPSQIKKSKNHFCSKSCAAQYNNRNKTKGTRRSKLEIWLEDNLKNRYPNLFFKFNKTEDINAELDIFIPSLKLAFELNGIFHYEPIYGSEKLASIQNNDERKFQACLEHGIELCIIDTSQQKYFKEKTSKKYLDIIINIIENRIAAGGIRTPVGN